MRKVCGNIPQKLGNVSFAVSRTLRLFYLNKSSILTSF